jgi:hypothetical protein
VRRFTGKVSKEALKDQAILRLEHFKRMQTTTLTQLVEKHLKCGLIDTALVEWRSVATPMRMTIRLPGHA